MSDMDLLHALLAPVERDDRFFGVAIGLVTSIQDPENMGRIKVRFPWLSAENESNWARLATPMAGPDRGFYFVPEVGNEVLCAFEHGDINFPCVIGSLWNGKDRPPVSDPQGKNDIRLIKSRSGHVLAFDDSVDDPKIEITDRTGANKITISTSDDAISIEAKGDISLSAGGKISLSGAGVDIDGGGGRVNITTSGAMSVKAGPTLEIKGGVVKLN